jgi:hypothetical protein
MNIVSIQFKIKEHKMIIDGETDTGGKRRHDLLRYKYNVNMTELIDFVLFI